MHHVSCTNTYHDVTDFVKHRMAKNIKTYTFTEHNFLIKQKISSPLAQMADFEKILFCSGGDL